MANSFLRYVSNHHTRIHVATVIDPSLASSSDRDLDPSLDLPEEPAHESVFDDYENPFSEV